MGKKAAITIDRVSKEDLDQVLVIERASFSMPWSRNLFLAEFRNPDVSLMLAARSQTDKSRVIGYIVCWIVADELHIRAYEQHIRAAPLWRQAIHSALDADRFDLEDWTAATTAIPELTKHDNRAADEFCGRPVQDAFLSLVRRMAA